MKKTFALVCILTPALTIGQGQLNTPAQDSVQSGSNVIEGYHCAAHTASEIFGIIDGTTRVDMIFPYHRGATQSVCSHTMTGYMTNYFWSRLKPGEHTIRMYIDGVELDSATFTTVALENGFIQPAQPDPVTVQDWPYDGETTTLCWKESLQDWGVCGHELAPDKPFNQAQTEKMIGTWRVQYSHSGQTFQQTYRLPGPALEHPTEAGEYVLLGFDSAGNMDVAGGWYGAQSTYGILDQYPLFDRLFLFDSIDGNRITGCYFQLVGDDVLPCIGFVGERTSLKALTRMTDDDEPSVPATRSVDNAAYDVADMLGAAQ